ncbi:MAG: hypothetical protein ACTSPI_06340 [Candidatus Heimdallarchaeaceae archaeon]
MYAAFLVINNPKKDSVILALEPKDFLEILDTEDLKIQHIAYEGTEGEFISISHQNYQVVSLVIKVKVSDVFDGIDSLKASLGFILTEDTNPLPFRNLLISLVEQVKKYEKELSLEMLQKLVPELLALQDKDQIEITLDEEKIKLTLEQVRRSRFELLKESLWGI